MSRTNATRTRLHLRPDPLVGNILSKRVACDLHISCLQFAASQPKLGSALTPERQIQTRSLQQSRCLFAVIFLHFHGFAVSVPRRALAQDRVATSRFDDFGRWREIGRQDKSSAVGWGREGWNCWLCSAIALTTLLASCLRNAANWPFHAPSLF